MTDPYRLLGLDRSATPDDIRRARRALAKHVHPDTGGDAGRMQQINAAAAAALWETIDRAKEPKQHHFSPRREGATTPPGREGSDGRRIDTPSFTVEALPVETFEGLLVAAAVLGEIEDDDPPYELGVLLADPVRCWCRLSIVPDAGASTVSLAITPAVDAALPDLDMVRDAWITQLNALDWSQF